MADADAQFEAAYTDARQLKTATQDELLEMYALGKIAKGEKVEKPGMFNLGEAKYKYEAYKKKADAGLTQDQAKQQYIEHVRTLIQKNGLKDGHTPQLK